MFLWQRGYLRQFFSSPVPKPYTLSQVKSEDGYPTGLRLLYTVLHMFRQVLFGAGNQGNHQNFEKSLLTNKL